MSSLNRNSFEAIAFDFGNTLCPWDDNQYWQVVRAAMRHICTYAPGHDFESAYQVFSRYRSEECARCLPKLRENDLPFMLKATAEELSGRAVSDSELQDVIRVQTSAFVSVCPPQPGLDNLLDRLSRKYRLAVLSNYSLSDCIRLSIENMGIARHFETIMVSADLGIIKPSRELFGSLLAKLSLPPEKVLFVGDDPLADVIGAWASGMQSVQVTGHVSEDFARRMGSIFGGYLRQALELPGYTDWREAKPLAILDSVFDLEGWLDGK